MEGLRGIFKAQLIKMQSHVSNPSHGVPLYHGYNFSEARLVSISSILCSLATAYGTGCILEINLEILVNGTADTTAINFRVS